MLRNKSSSPLYIGTEISIFDVPQDKINQFVASKYIGAYRYTRDQLLLMKSLPLSQLPSNSQEIRCDLLSPQNPRKLNAILMESIALRTSNPSESDSNSQNPGSSSENKIDTKVSESFILKQIRL